MSRKEDWLPSLPIALLGIRCLPSINNISPFTAVTGTSLLCPRNIIEKVPKCDTEFVKTLAARMKEIDFASLAEGSNHSSKKVFIPKNLEDCSHVWLRTDRIRRPLEAPYSGPFKVIHRTPKIF